MRRESAYKNCVRTETKLYAGYVMRFVVYLFAKWTFEHRANCLRKHIDIVTSGFISKKKMYSDEFAKWNRLINAWLWTTNRTTIAIQIKGGDRVHWISFLQLPHEHRTHVKNHFDRPVCWTCVNDVDIKENIGRYPVNTWPSWHINTMIQQ